MKFSSVRSFAVLSGIVFSMLLLCSVPAFAVDGKKWDGKKYQFALLDPSKTNSEANPFIIDTAGKLAFFGELAKCERDMVAYGKTSGLKGLAWAFKDNYIKLTTDLDMNGSQFEFTAIPDNGAFFDGGGHVLTNLRISDKTTPPYINPDTGDAEIYLGLFQDIESVKNLGIGKGSSVTYSGVSKLTLMVYAGSLAAKAYKIDNCYSEAAVTIRGNGEALVAGLAAEGAYVTNSSNRGPIVFEGNVIFSRAKNSGKKAGPSWLKVGGVCARVDKTMTGCCNTGSITVTASGDDLQIGGVSADTNNSICADLSNAGAIRVTATGDIKTAAIGGVLGHNYPYPSNPKFKTDGYADSGYICNKGSIDVSVMTGKSIAVGGVGGGMPNRDYSFANSSAEFTGVYGFINTYNSGAVTATATGAATLNVGGIAGSGAMIINSYNTGKISGTSATGSSLNIGGLGGSDVYVQNSYTIGPVAGKGTGVNKVGGVMGLAGVVWGESDRVWYSLINAFWLKQTATGGVNGDIKYGKGSYFYKKQSDIKKEGLGVALEVMDALTNKNADPNAMVEDYRGGFVYSFDSPSSAVMKRTDDDPGKRTNLNGTLLANLNQMAEEKIDRLYRKWIIDGTNGGYPVLSSTPTVFSRNAEKPDATAAAQIAGEYAAIHKNWNDKMILYADGTFKRLTGTDGGTWSYDGKQLVIKWKKWTPEILAQKGPGSFSCNAYQFTLVRSVPAVTAATVTPAVAAAPAALTDAEKLIKKISGVYYAQHGDWSGNLTLNADGTFIRVGNGEGGTWTCDAKTLVLNWYKLSPETLLKYPAGFYCATYKFTMRPF